MNFRGASASLVVFLAVAGPTWAAPPAEVTSSVELVKNLETLVGNEFIYKTPPTKLYMGAAQGLNEAIKARKKKPVTLKPISDKLDSKAAQSTFIADYSLVAEKYPDLTKDGYLRSEAIKGMLKILDDPYTVYMSKAEYEGLKEAMNGGNFGGVGIYIDLDKTNSNLLTVTEPIEDTPASRAGILPRDIIIAIDGKDTTKITIEGAQQLLRGGVGSPVVLTIRRQGSPEPINVKLLRDRIRVNSVRHKVVEKDGLKIGYLSLKSFGDHANEEIEGALRDLERKGIQAVAFDLRNNGGGYITAAVDTCSKFLKTGSRVVSVEERGEGLMTYDSHPNLHPHLPLVLLVNQYSASASEITAGALQDTKRAKLVGVKTFGKGSVQKIFPLPDGSALKVTTAHYLTPAGKDINKVGIEPDIKIEMPVQKMGGKEDAQFEAAIAELASQIKNNGSSYPSSLTVTNSSTALGVAVQNPAQELEMIEAEVRQGFVVTSRQIQREGNGLVEQVQLKRGSEEKVLRFDISGFLR